jgi:hypothetical protein
MRILWLFYCSIAYILDGCGYCVCSSAVLPKYVNVCDYYVCSTALMHLTWMVVDTVVVVLQYCI